MKSGKILGIAYNVIPVADRLDRRRVAEHRVPGWL